MRCGHTTRLPAMRREPRGSAGWPLPTTICLRCKAGTAGWKAPFNATLGLRTREEEEEEEVVVVLVVAEEEEEKSDFINDRAPRVWRQLETCKRALLTGPANDPC